jgi:hypothetical protein
MVGATFESFACVEASPVHASSTGAKIVNPLDVTPSSAAAPLLDTASNAVLSLVRPWAERVVVGIASAAERLTGKPMTWTARLVMVRQDQGILHAVGTRDYDPRTWRN